LIVFFRFLKVLIVHSATLDRNGELREGAIQTNDDLRKNPHDVLSQGSPVEGAVVFRVAPGSEEGKGYFMRNELSAAVNYVPQVWY
jgi:hypothetical protein